MELKYIVELAMSHTFTDNTIQCMACKILDHKQLLQEVFPNLRLRPKHHYIEHYPCLIMCFGPLVHLWTMRCEGKHKVFKKIVCDSHNYKNVLKTLAERHQNMTACYLSSHRLFKPPVQTSKVESVFIESLPINRHPIMLSITDSSIVYHHITQLCVPLYLVSFRPVLPVFYFGSHCVVSVPGQSPPVLVSFPPV